MAGAWSEEEVDAAVATYFEMLRLELRDQPYNKAEFRRRLLDSVDRSNGSIEFKFANISAVLSELGAVFIDGYKPRSNVQNLLRKKVIAALDSSTDLSELMASRSLEPPTEAAERLGDPVDPPVLERQADVHWARVPIRRDYNLLEASNRALGLRGEQLVVERERGYLQSAGRSDLTDQVRHVSVDLGDGLGYDVLSFDLEGRKRYLEVKATRWSRYQPFYVSRNEVSFSEEVGDQFALVRVFGVGRGCGHYELGGPLRSSTNLVPETYRGFPRVI